VELKLQIVLKGQLDHLANPVNLAKMVILVKLENPELPLKQQNLFKVVVVCHVLLVLPDLLVLKAQLVHQVVMDILVNPGLLEDPDNLELKDQLVMLVLLVPQVNLEALVKLVLLEPKDTDNLDQK
jgi:hypothetical protein